MNNIIIYPLEFVERQCEYETIYTLKFKSAQAIPFTAGQWLHLGFPTETKDKTKVRHMSISSAPDDPYLEFTMDLGSGSWYKDQMKMLKQGDIIRAFKINGTFVVAPSIQRPVVFVSGGIGITPVRSIVRDLQYKKTNTNWSLLHVSRSHFLYKEELSKLTNKQWRVHRNELDNVWSEALTHKNEALYYVSGSERFVEGIKEKLALSGISTENIIVEDFNK